MKHHLVASFYASLASVVSLMIIDFLGSSETSILGGVLLVPILLVCCVVLSYPLIYIRSKLKLSKFQSVMLFVLTGSIFGAITPLLMFPWLTVDSDNIAISLQYSFAGFMASITAWFYVRRYIEI